MPWQPTKPLAGVPSVKADVTGNWDYLDRFMDGRVNVKTEFGAMGDDTANDAPALQAALNSGRKLYIPPGSYKISSPLLTSATLGFDIMGESPNYNDPRRYTQIVGTFNSSTGEPMLHPDSGYISKDNTWIDGPNVANKGSLHPGSVRSLAFIANNDWGACLQMHNLVNPSCFTHLAISSKFRGILFSQGFDVEVSNIRFAGTVYSVHDFNDRDLMLRCFALAFGVHGSVHTCSAVGYGIGFWLSGFNVHAHALRAETNYIGVRLGGPPNMGFSALGDPQGLLTHSNVTAITCEANYTGVLVENLDEGGHLGPVHVQGSPVGEGRPFASRSGIEVSAGLSPQSSIGPATIGGDYSHAPIVLPIGSPSRLRSLVGHSGTLITAYPKTIGGSTALTSQAPGAIMNYHFEKQPINFLRHASLDWQQHTITAHSDLQLRGLKGLDVFSTNIQPNNFGKIETVTAAATSLAVTFPDGIGRPQIEEQPTAQADVTSTLAAGTYYYAISFIATRGETAAAVMTAVTTTAGQRVRLKTYGGIGGVSALRVYRGTIAGLWVGCFEVPAQSTAGWDGTAFLDTGQAFTGTKEWPVTTDGGIPSRFEVDTNYGIIATPSWATTVHVSAKATTGFNLNFTAPGGSGGQISWLLFRS